MAASYSETQPFWTWQDQLGALAVRCAYRRMQYTVQPGLYAINAPDAESPVFVSANYKLSFNHLRRALKGISGWILVLDTKGVNVWCAAGKGTFGTKELVARIAAVDLNNTVTHRQLIVPQLGAPGIAAHEVHKRSGFRVIYGPVRANDIARFLESNSTADDEMRRVRYTLSDRLAVVPVEMVGSTLKAGILAAVFAVSAAHHGGIWSWAGLQTDGLLAAGTVLVTYAVVSVLVAACLPWLPGRAFSVKGVWAGMLTWGLLEMTGLYGPAMEQLTWLILLMAMGSFMGLNLTGASTYTSLSGVKKETRIAVPFIIAGILLSVGLWTWACGIL